MSTRSLTVRHVFLVQQGIHARLQQLKIRVRVRMEHFLRRVGLIVSRARLGFRAQSPRWIRYYVLAVGIRVVGQSKNARFAALGCIPLQKVWHRVCRAQLDIAVLILRKIRFHVGTGRLQVAAVFRVLVVALGRTVAIEPIPAKFVHLDILVWILHCRQRSVHLVITPQVGHRTVCLAPLVRKARPAETGASDVSLDMNALIQLSLQSSVVLVFGARPPSETTRPSLYVHLVRPEVIARSPRKNPFNVQPGLTPWVGPPIVRNVRPGRPVSRPTFLQRVVNRANIHCLERLPARPVRLGIHVQIRTKRQSHVRTVLSRKEA